MRVHFADVDAARTRYYDAGEGPPLLLVHGIGVTAEIWLRNIAPLARTHRVCAPDLLASGLTGAGRYGVEQTGPILPFAVDHLLALADHLRFDRFAVAGSSLGGLVAALVALRAPARVTKLVLVAAGSVFQDEAKILATWQAALANGRGAFESPTYENCRARIERVLAKKEAATEALLLMQMTCFAAPGALEAFERRGRGMLDAAALRPYLIKDRLEMLRLPTLVALGADDPRVDHEEARRHAARLPNARVSTFEGCGHYPQLESPEVFNALLEEFLH